MRALPPAQRRPYAKGMMLRRHMLVLMFALSVLLIPSFTAGLSAVAASAGANAAVTVADHGGPSQTAYRPCKHGGKRVLPCQPDSGILVPALAVPAECCAGLPPLRAAAMRQLPTPSADPPPPRLG